MLIWIIIGVIAALAVIILYYLFIIYPWSKRWGATDAEVQSDMLGDDIVKHPQSVTTRAITIRAPVTIVWPWLIQMGYQRGGMYSYDWIDRLLGILDRPSANRIIPEFQHLEVGDVIPMGAGPSWPVKAIESNRSLLLDIRDKGVHITWSFLLEEFDTSSTRLILRIRSYLAMSLFLFVTLPIMIPGDFIMTRKYLLGLKRRAESLATQTEEKQK